MDEQKPGDVISPRNSQGDQSTEVSVQIPRGAAPNPSTNFAPTLVNTEQEQAAPTPQPPLPPVESTPAPAVDVPQQPIATPVPEAPTAFAPNDDVLPNDQVAWTASEFIHHAKSLNWYLVLGIVGLLSSIIVYFVTKDIFSTIIIAVVAILFGAYAATSKPRVLPYEINASGIQIGPKHYAYANFKTFSVIHDSNAFSKVELMPLKRFAPPVSMYFPPEDEETIARTLSEYLPYEERKPDATDRLLNKIRF